MEIRRIQTISDAGGGTWSVTQTSVPAPRASACVTGAVQTLCWPDVPSTLDLAPGRLDIWLVPLDGPFSGYAAVDLLSADERKRAERFHLRRDRERFVRARSALRILLGRYLRFSPTEIQFDYQAAGKPEVAAQQNLQALRFNLSHSGRLALIAVCAGRRVGIDVEEESADIDIPGVAERFFSLRERAGLASLPSDLRVAAFYACWTRKESFLKATGAGLSFPLADFSVSTHPERPPILEQIRGDSEAGRRWYLADIGVGEGFRAAVAIESAESARYGPCGA